MSTEELYHEIMCATTDTYIMEKEMRERDEFISYMAERSREIESMECPICGNITLEVSGINYCFCQTCKSTINI